MTRTDVAVIGGGLAGIAAAVRLADAGASVTLLESRPRLGGATYSFDRGGRSVDTGQHVFLRCYTAYIELLERLGTRSDVDIQDRFEVPVLAAGAEPHLLRRARMLPAPLHLLGALARYAPLSPAERLAAMRAAVALRFIDPDAPGSDTHSLGEFFARHRQSPATVRRLWELVAVAALNVGPDDASLALAARVFRTGMLASARGGDIGRPRVSLSALHGEPAARLLSTLGVRVRTRAKVDRVEPTNGGYRIHLADGPSSRDERSAPEAGESVLSAPAVVLAVPHQAAAGLVPDGAVPDPTRWAGLSATAIVNVHLVFDRKVTDFEFAAAIDSPVQWMFDRTAGSGLETGQYLAISLSAADDIVRRPAADLIAEQLAALRDLLPAARSAELVEAFVTREPRATFRQSPGTRLLRPAAATALGGLALAGAWTATGWPDTMEGAVRSGHMAADSVTGFLGATPTASASRTAIMEVKAR